MEKLTPLHAFFVALSVATAAAQQLPTESIEVVATFSYPGSHVIYTQGGGINNTGFVAGFFVHHFPEMSFLRSAAGKFSPPISASPTGRTFAWAINDDGLVAGEVDEPLEIHGFFYQDGVLTSYLVPGSDFTLIYGLNNAGDFTGLYALPEAATVPFASLGGAITNVGVPGASFTWPHGINTRGEIVGYYTEPSSPGEEHGYLRTADGRFLDLLDFPGATNTQLWGVNDQGTIVGFWDTDFTSFHGLVQRKHGQFTQIDLPDAVETLVTGINNSGLITGRYTTRDGGTQGFIARIVP